MAVFVYRASCFPGTSESLKAIVPGLCRWGFCLPFFSVFSVERRFQKLDLDPQHLVFNYLSADAVETSNLSHGLSAAEKFMDLLDTLGQSVVCLPLLAFFVPC
jgi:hypothetical protein